MADDAPSQLVTISGKAVRVNVVLTQCFDIGNDEISRVFTNREDSVQCHLLQKLQRF